MAPDIKQIDPELAEILATQPELESLDIGEMREHASRNCSPWSEQARSQVEIEISTVLGGDGDRPLWVVKAPGSSGQPILYVHGGGWSVCDLNTHLSVFAGLARATKSPVHAVHQRRAPENPYPAALEDVTAAVSEMSRENPDGFALAGDSAGANLALASLLSLRDNGERPPVTRMVLYYGCYLRKFDTESHTLYGDGSFGLTTEKMRRYWELYAEDHSQAVYSDLSAFDFSELPPAQVHVAELDILRDDSLWLAERLAAAGNDSELIVWEGMNHGFLNFAPQLSTANTAFTASANFIHLGS